MSKIPEVGLIVFFIFKIFATAGIAANKDSSFSVDYQKGTLIIQANQVPLGKILNGITRECGIKIRGLENREKEPVTFSSESGTLSQTLRRLLSLLDEGNYAFEFRDQALVRIVVFPKAEGVMASRPAPRETEKKPEKKIEKPPESTEQETKQEFVKVPNILQVNDDSQAQAVGLLKGDLIVEYDGVQIKSSAQLLSEVKKKADREEVEIVVIRDKREMRFSLEGGEIGVGVGDEKIPKEEFGSYY